MQILLDNGAYELGNVGDVAMLQVAVARLRCQWPDAQIHVLNDYPEALQSLCPGVSPLLTDGRNLWFQERNLFGGAYRFVPRAASASVVALERQVRMRMNTLAEPWIQRRLRNRCDVAPMVAYRQAFHRADLVAASGGGYINDSFPRHAALVLATLRDAQMRGKATAMFGQGLGPLTDPGLRRLAAHVLPRLTLLTLREGRAGRQLLHELGVSDAQIEVTGDDAIEAAYQARKPELGNAVGLNIRLASYAALDESVLDTLGEALRGVLTELDAEAVAVPVSFHKGDSDSRSLSALLERLGISDDIPDRLTPGDVMERVSRCRVVLTGSYHAGVFALSQGIPVIAIANSRYYEAKFRGLAEQFPGGVRTIRIETGNGAVVVEALQSAWHSAPDSREALLRAAEAQLQSGKEAYRRLAACIPTPKGAA